MHDFSIMREERKAIIMKHLHLNNVIFLLVQYLLLQIHKYVDVSYKLKVLQSTKPLPRIVSSTLELHNLEVVQRSASTGMELRKFDVNVMDMMANCALLYCTYDM